MHIMKTMFSNNVHTVLALIASRLRTERLARNETQVSFAARLGVSTPTLRRLEQGDASAQIGHWLAALEVLGQLQDAESILPPRNSLFVTSMEPGIRQRARRQG